MASKKCTWAILGLCASLAASSVTLAADRPAKQSNAKHDTVVCRYVDSPGGRIKRHVCETRAESAAAQSRVGLSPTTGASLGSPPIAVPGMSGFSNPANQSGYQQFR
jgi:hypothetical protein